MKRIIITLLAVMALALGGASGPVRAAPGSDGNHCHGANTETCRPDPQPSHGADCLPHGNNPDGNDDHCTGEQTSVPPASASPSPESSATPSVEPSAQPSPSASPDETPAPSASPTEVTEPSAATWTESSAAPSPAQPAPPVVVSMPPTDTALASDSDTLTTGFVIAFVLTFGYALSKTGRKLR